MFNQSYELTWETVAVPLVKGLNLRARARLVEPPALLKAKNVRFPRSGGPEKRSGHSAEAIRVLGFPAGHPTIAPVTQAPGAPNPYGHRSLPPNWLYGFGGFDPANLAVVTGAMGTTGIPINIGATGELSPRPDPGVLFGAATRDDEAVVWDGFRMFSRSPSQQGAARLIPLGATACMPAVRTRTIAEVVDDQGRPDAADNGLIRVVTWTNSGSVAGDSLQIFDSKTGAALSHTYRLGGTNDYIRAIPVGSYVHVYARSTSSNAVLLFVLNPYALPTATSLTATRTLDGSLVNYAFDVRKVTEDLVLLATVDDTPGTGTVHCRWLQANGNDSTEFGAATFTPALGAAAGLVTTVAVAVHPTTFHVGLALSQGTSTSWHRTYTPTGAAATALVVLSTTGSAQRIATDSNYMLTDGGVPRWTVFIDTDASGTRRVYRFRVGGASVLDTRTRHNVHLASCGFRVGERVFVWANWQSALQTTWLLLDDYLNVCGAVEHGTAFANTDAGPTTLPGVNWNSLVSVPAKDRTAFHLALPYRVRLPADGQNDDGQVGVYSEPSVKFVEMDFLPRLRAAQAGRSTYFAGAQLWQYDGVGLHEAGFHVAPEGVTATSSGAGGSLTASGVYTWRVDLCHKNAAGEEVRSASLFWYSNGATTPTALPGGHNRAVISGPTIPTRRAGSYLLVWRNETAGGAFYLVSSRDPASANFVINDWEGSPTWTFTDTTADSALLNSEIHPGNTPGFLQPFPAHASEVIASGRDRLWLAGGEIPPGVVAPSRLFFPGESPSFNEAVNIQMDRGIEPITAIGFTGDLSVAFRRSSILAVDSDGPDNLNQGGWSIPRLVLTDTGAVSQESVARVDAGLVFQALGGIRLLKADSGISPVGIPVDPLAETLSVAATVVNPATQEVRFYGDVGHSTLVWSYEGGEWSEWTLTCAGAVRTSTGDVVLASHLGNFWTESTAESTDAGQPYEFLVRLGWLHGGNSGDFLRVRRVAGFGELRGQHTLRVRVYYDDRDFHGEEFTWDTSQDLVSSMWGDGTWGSGIWGNALGTQPDAVWRWRRRLSRQKCNALSVEFSDLADPGFSFVPVVVAFEVGRRGGLDRIPARTYDA